MRIKYAKSACYLLAAILIFTAMASFGVGEGDDPPIEPLQDFTHTVFVEEMTQTTCVYCPELANAFNDVYKSHDYDYYFVALIEDVNENASARKDDYNIPGYPSAVFDGGYETHVGAAGEEEIRPLIESCGERETPSLDMSISLQHQGGAILKIDVEVVNNEAEDYPGHIRVYINERISRYIMYDGEPYHFGFLDYAINEEINIPSGGSYQKSVIWNGAQNEDSLGNDFGDIDFNNIIVIGAVFDDEPHFSNYPTPYGAYVFTAYYVDQAAATPLYESDVNLDQSNYDIKAGESDTIPFTVRNTGNVGGTFDLTLSGQAASWGVLDKNSLTLQPGQEDNVTLTVDVPYAAQGQEYFINITADPPGSPGLATTSPVTINVLVYGVDISAPDNWHAVHPGNSTTYYLNVSNTGNVDDTIQLTMQGAASSWATLTPESIELAGGAYQEITLDVDVPSDAEENTYQIDITATSQNDTQKYDSVSTYTNVSIASVFGVSLTPDVLGKTTNPGQSVIYTINVQNTGNTQDTYSITKSGAKSEWGALSKTSVTLISGSSEDITFTVTVPADASNGDYPINVKATSQGDPSTSQEIILTTTVEEINYGVELDPASQDETVEIGDSKEFTITVKNTGDVEEEISLSIITPQSYDDWASLSQESMNLASGASKNVILTIDVPSSADAGDYTFTVKGVYTGDTSISDEAVVTLTVKVPVEFEISDVTHNPLNPTSDDEITVKAKVTGEDITSVRLYYCMGGICYPPKTMQSIGNDEYSGTFGPLEAGNYQYYVWAKNSDNEEDETQKYTLTVSQGSGIVDTDGDGVNDDEDDFPDDPAASVDSDGDDYPDEWNLGKSEEDSTTGLTLDAFPEDSTQWSDSDGDGYGDNPDGNNPDEYPDDPTRWSSTLETGDEKPWYETENAKYMIMLLLIVIVICAILAGVFMRPKKTGRQIPTAVAVQQPIQQQIPMAATEPVFAPTPVPQLEDISCPKCYTVFSVPTDVRPLEVQCPSCATRGIID